MTAHLEQDWLQSTKTCRMTRAVTSLHQAVSTSDKVGVGNVCFSCFIVRSRIMDNRCGIQDCKQEQYKALHIKTWKSILMGDGLYYW